MTALASSFSSAQGAPKEVPKDVYIYIYIIVEFFSLDIDVRRVLYCGLYNILVKITTLHTKSTRTHKITTRQQQRKKSSTY